MVAAMAQRTLAWWLLSVPVLAACVGPTSLRIETTSAEGLSLASCTIAVVTDGLEIAARSYPDQGGGPIVGTTDVLLADRSQTLAVHAIATDRLGRRFELESQVTSVPHRETRVHFIFGDALAASCRDGMRSGDESDLDCGGALCPPCAVHAACTAGGDCQTSHCVDKRCVLANGPPAWIAVGDVGVPDGRYEVAAALDAGGRPYAIGGTSGAGRSARVDYLDLPSARWVRGDDLPAPLSKHDAVSTADGRIYVAGVDDAGAAVAWAASDPSTPQGGARWSAFSPRPSPRYDAALVRDSVGTLYAIGGTRGAGSLADGEALSGSAWVALPALLEPRTLLSGAVGSDGAIYLFGGYDYEAIASIDRLMPGESRWTRSQAHLSAPRYRTVALGAPDGRIYVIGGETGGPAAGTIDAYTPGDDTSDTLAPNAFPRAAFGGVVLADGRLLIFGGVASATAPPSELYGPVVTLTAPAGGARGTSVSVAGSNFAANAPIHLYLDAQHVPTVTGTTDASGAVASLSFRVPALVPGRHTVRVVDEYSRYPAMTSLTVPE